MSITIKGVTYRNLQEQVKKNQEDIEELKHTSLDAYSKEQADEIFQTKAGMSDYATTEDITQALSGKQDKLTAGDNIDITDDTIKLKDIVEIVTKLSGEGVVVKFDDSTFTADTGIVGVEAKNSEAGLYFTNPDSNDAGWIKMSHYVPEMYSSRDHMHGEYSNTMKLYLSETDVKIDKYYQEDDTSPVVHTNVGILEELDNRMTNNSSETMSSASGISKTIAETNYHNSCTWGATGIQLANSNSSMGTNYGNNYMEAINPSDGYKIYLRDGATTKVYLFDKTKGGTVATVSDIPTVALNKYYVQADFWDGGSTHYFVNIPIYSPIALTTGSTTYATIKPYLIEYMHAVEDNVLKRSGYIGTIGSTSFEFYYYDENAHTQQNITVSNTATFTINA